MITYKTGDIFSSKAQVLVNPVNTVGVMGKGLALEFKKRYPRMYPIYQRLCDAKHLKTGYPLLWLNRLRRVGNNARYVMLFPTKMHWRDPSKVSYIADGLRSFVKRMHNGKYQPLVGYSIPIESIAFPALGCGLGGLDFESQVKPLMEQYLSDLPIDVEVYTSKKGSRR